MNKEEFLLAEHQKLVELYKHQWTNLFYLDVSYMICNGALASFVGVLLSFQPPSARRHFGGISCTTKY